MRKTIHLSTEEAAKIVLETIAMREGWDAGECSIEFDGDEEEYVIEGPETRLYDEEEDGSYEEDYSEGYDDEEDYEDEEDEEDYDEEDYDDDD